MPAIHKKRDKPRQISLAALEAIVGPANVLTAAADLAAYLTEPRGLFRGCARCVVRPGSTQEVAAIVRHCAATATPIVPQGGNTGLVGGQIPDAGGDAAILSLTRMRALREIDLSTSTMTVEAGMTLAAARAEAERAGRLFPLSLASEGSCTIGGNLATNAGGTGVIAYGNARDLVLGLEVVLADGRVYSGLSKLRKDNTGYDLKHLFMGSEGTLGVITAAVLKLCPKPRAVETAFIGLASPRDAVALLDLARERTGSEITAFEIIPRLGLDFTLARSPGARRPLAGRHDWHVLLELGSQMSDGLAERMLGLLAEAAARGLVADAAVAASERQRRDFWGLRENLPDAQRFEGASIKHDVSVAVADVPAFLADVTAALAVAAPGTRLVAFGHLGDGNIHCNVSQPKGAEADAFLARSEAISAVVHQAVARYGGSIAAEHGVGQLKRELLAKVKDPVALELMRALKSTLDPKGILNPGKVL